MMKTILVTGANGFVGRNLCISLAQRKDVELFRYDLDSTPEALEDALTRADVVFHLAGVNRPLDPADFLKGNADFTQQVCDRLLALKRTPLVVLASSTQAELDNPYGISKRQAEVVIEQYALKCAALRSPSSPSSLDVGRSALDVQRSPSSSAHSPLPSPFAIIYRLPNVFGKWCRPNYNSAVATWCHNVARDLPIQVRDPSATVTLVYVDDVVDSFIHRLHRCTQSGAGAYTEQISENPCNLWIKKYCDIAVTYTKTLGEITALIEGFKQSRTTLQIPDQADGFSKKLYATYLSYLPTNQFSYPLKMNVDVRGSFTEFIKTAERGQISVNISKPGVTKGNHWHHTKLEKFLVVSGKGVIRFRRVGEIKRGGVNELCEFSELGKKGEPGRGPGEGLTQRRRDAEGENGIIEYWVSGEKLEVVDIPPGYTHNIENLGDEDMVTIMWASEAFDPERPDTFFEKVGSGE